MSFLFYATNLLLLVSFVVLARATVSAPEGHEDEKGFHLGTAGEERSARRVSVKRSRKAVPAFAKIDSRHLAA